MASTFFLSYLTLPIVHSAPHAAKAAALQSRHSASHPMEYEGCHSNAVAYRGCADRTKQGFVNVLVPPRCGISDYMPQTPGWQRCAATAFSSPSLNITTVPDGCFVHVNASVRSGMCLMRLDMCRQQELLNAVQGAARLQSNAWTDPDMADLLKDHAVIRPMWPFWDGSEVHAYGRNGLLNNPSVDSINEESRGETGESIRQSNMLARTFKSCAVVGGAPTLLGSGLGADIDNHDAVFRFNDHPGGALL